MGKERFPSTPATRFLKEKGVPFELHSYKYEEHGGTEKSSRDLQRVLEPVPVSVGR